VGGEVGGSVSGSMRGWVALGYPVMELRWSCDIAWPDLTWLAFVLHCRKWVKPQKQSSQRPEQVSGIWLAMSWGTN